MKGKITKLPLSERKKSFKEVSQGFSQNQALKEAERCLQCKDPLCKIGCPAGINIKSFIQSIREHKYAQAIKKIKEANNIPGVCGRVCPQEKQCQMHCILNRSGSPIQIGYLERFVADWEFNVNFRHSGACKYDKNGSSNKLKVAIIGSGPAGLSCAGDLAKKGFEVYLFEALHKPGGVLVYGIPEFRLPKAIVERELIYVKSLGVKIITNFLAGRTKTIEDLRSGGFKAFFISIGSGSPRFLNIPGENCNNIYSANEFLTRINLMKSYLFPQYTTPVIVGKKIGVFGAGNVSFDCARCALRLGAKEVNIIYRRSEKEMPARNEEIENAKEEGVKIILLTSPLKFLSDDRTNLKAIQCVKNKLGLPDGSGRRYPVAIAGSNFTMEFNTAVVAIGTLANPLLLSVTDGLALTHKGFIKIDHNYQTSISDIFAGGDIVSGSATVIDAIAQAKGAALSIEHFLKNRTKNCG